MKGEHTGYRLRFCRKRVCYGKPEKDHYMPGEMVELIVHPAQGYTFSHGLDLSGIAREK